ALHAAVGNADIEMHPILGSFWFGHALDVHARASTGRVDDRGLIPELLLGHADGVAEVFPRCKPRWRRLGDVVQRECPKLSKFAWLGRIENDLNVRVHAQEGASPR